MSADLEVPTAAPTTDVESDEQNPQPTLPRERSQWTYLLFSLTVIFLAFFMSAPGEEEVFLPGTSAPLPGLCMTRTTLGVDCPGCGLTRCFISLAHGQFERAWHFNPAGYLLFAVFVAQVPLRLAQIVRIRTGRELLKESLLTRFLGLVGVCLVLQWAVKMCGHLVA